MKAYIKIVDKLNKLLEWLVVVVLVILSFVVLAQVVTRKCHISVAWLEEMARYSMIWLCFLGAAVACRRGSLIKIDILYELLWWPSTAVPSIFPWDSTALPPA